MRPRSDRAEQRWLARTENSGYVTERYLGELAEQVGGLNPIAWTAVRSDAALAREIAADALAARRKGLRSTPSFIVRSGNSPYASAILKQLRESR